jgi:outer membrane protein
MKNICSPFASNKDQMRLLKIGICLLLLPLAAIAQLRFNSLQELVQYADKNGVTAKQAQLQARMAAEDVHISASGLYPKVNAFATGDYYPIIASQVIPAEVIGGTPGTYLKAQFGLPYVFTTGAEFSMPVVNLEKWAQLSKARAQYTQAQWGSKTTLANYHIQLAQAYYQALVTRAVLELNNENRTVADELLRMMDQRNQAGVVNPSDYNRSRNLQLDVTATGSNYYRAMQQAQNNLLALLANGEKEITIDDSLGRFGWPSLQSPNDITNRAAWQEAVMRQRVAELGFKESKRGALPRLSFNGRYAYNMQTKWNGDGQKVEFDVANVSMRLDVPLFQGNYYRSLRRKSSLQLQYADLELQRTKATLTQQHGDWYEQYTAAYSKQKVLNDKVRSATDNLRIARLNMAEGVMEFDEFNNIFMEYNRARMEQLQNTADGILYYLLSTQNF